MADLEDAIAELRRDLIPRADAELAVAGALENAAAAVDAEWRRKIGLNCTEVCAIILALAPADALAEVQRLQARVTSLSEQVDTIAEQRDTALARVEKLREAASLFSETAVLANHKSMLRAVNRIRAALAEDARHG